MRVCCISREDLLRVSTGQVELEESIALSHVPT